VQNSPTAPRKFKLRTEARKDITRKLKQFTHDHLDAIKRQLAERQEAVDKEQVRALRKQTEFKANPVPAFLRRKYKELIAKSNKQKNNARQVESVMAS
jgi:hypothetical protein